MNQFTASLWGDEGFSAILSMKSIPEILSIIARDTSPPLYNLTEHLWFKVFGTSEVAIRSLSFLYYLIAIFFVYLIAKSLFDRRTAILASVLTFLNPFFFIYAFEGRMYSIMAMGVAASFYFFISKKWVLYVVATALALYSHHFAIFAVFVQGTWFLKEFFWGNRRLAISMFKSFIAVGILYTPWLIPLYNQIKMVGGGFWLGKPTGNDLKFLIYDYLGQGINHPLSKYARYLVVLGLLFRDWLKQKPKSLLLILWFVGPILLTWLVSQKFQSIFYNRYLLYTIPGAMILLASERRKYISGLFVALTVLAFLAIDIHYFTHPTKRPFREFANLVLENKRGDDILINWNSSSHHLWETKYYGIPAPLYIPEGELPYFVGTALMEKDDIARTLPVRIDKKTKLSRIGVITSGPIDEISLEGYAYKEHLEVGDLKIVWMGQK